MAKTLIDGMTVAWDPSKFHDEYRENLKKWLSRRAKTGNTAAIEVEEDDSIPGPYNIMDLLKKSIEGQKKSGGRRSASSRRKAG